MTGPVELNSPDDLPTASTPAEQRGPGEPSSAPGVGRAELGQDEAAPQTEGERQAQAAVRSISRLEESN